MRHLDVKSVWPYACAFLVLGLALALAAFRPREPLDLDLDHLHAPVDCANAGGVWTFDVQLPAPRYYCLSPKGKERCIASGGEWTTYQVERVGCVHRSADGGKACSDSSQCRYGCVVPHEIAVTENTLGTCAPDNVTAGKRLYRRADGTTATIGIRE